MKVLFPAALLILVAMPAFAQEMRGPTTRQCQMGYKTSYMRTMNWSRATFRDACQQKMMMMKERKMMKKKDRM